MKTIPVFLASLAYISAVLAGKFIGLSTNGLIGLPVYAKSFYLNFVHVHNYSLCIVNM